jgi:hypothetical protein
MKRKNDQGSDDEGAKPKKARKSKAGSSKNKTERLVINSDIYDESTPEYKFLGDLVNSSFKNTKQKNEKGRELEHTLTKDQVMAKWIAQNGKCAYSNMPMICQSKSKLTHFLLTHSHTHLLTH